MFLTDFKMGLNWLPKLGLKEAKDYRIIFKLLAEMIGTMVLVFFSCGSAHNVQGSVVRYSLTFGFTVATMAQVSSFYSITDIKLIFSYL